MGWTSVLSIVSRRQRGTGRCTLQKYLHLHLHLLHFFPLLLTYFYIWRVQHVPSPHCPPSSINPPLLSPPLRSFPLQLLFLLLPRLTYLPIQDGPSRSHHHSKEKRWNNCLESNIHKETSCSRRKISKHQQHARSKTRSEINVESEY